MKLIEETLPCIDCKVDTDEIREYYHVHEPVWFAAFGKVYDEDMPWSEKDPVIKAGYLCIGCLEQRLGRKLRPDDFSDAPINSPVWAELSDRLMDRIGDTAFAATLKVLELFDDE